MVNSFSIINEKLKSFTKKYYLNKILKGIILWFLLLFLFLFSLLVLEYVLYLTIKIKIILLTSFLLFISFSFFYLIAIPFIKYLGFFKIISKKQISEIVVIHFPNIKDKLLNIIELNDEFEFSIYSKELIISSIEQKIVEITKYRFRDSINFKDNFKLVYCLLGAVILSLLISFFSPDFFQQTSYRLINYTQSFEKPSPYKFKILNENLKAGKGEDFLLRVSVFGKNNNDILNILLGGKFFLMKKDSTNYYSYKFNNINNNISFQFELNKYKSKYYKLEILEKPFLNSFSVHLDKPGYTMLKNEDFDNLTEFIVPEGTKIYFKFNSTHTDSLFIKENGFKPFKIESLNENVFGYNKIYKDNINFSVALKNRFFILEDYLKLNITTLKDEFPTISVQKISDSLDITKNYFKGIIGDDYGFSKLSFVIKNNDIIDTIIFLNFNKNNKNQDFNFAFDFNLYKWKYQNVNYFFEVFDNDEVNGPKAAISEIFTVYFPDEAEILENQKKDFDNIQDIIANSMSLTDKLKKDLIDLEKKLISSELTEWERKEIQKNILTKKNNIDKEIEKLKEKSKEISNYMNSFTNQDQEIIEKQKQIQDLLDNVFSDELKKLLDDFNKMIQELNKNKLNKTKEKLDISLDDLSKQLDKNLELLRKMEIEEQLDLVTHNLEKIIKEQDNIVNNIDSEFESKDIKKKEEGLKDKLLNTKKLYNEIDSLNKKLSDPISLMDFKQEFDKIQKEFENSIENLEKSRKNKSKESMKRNSDNLKDLDFKLKQMLDSLFKEQNSENMDDLLQILDNLIIFSFNQEELINSANLNNFNSINLRKQKKLFTDFEIIKDSLYSLSRREPSLDSKINKELVQIQYYFKEIENSFEENENSNVLIQQQRVLTSVNDLSLFLSEIIKQLQKNMANSMPGNKNCNKPGNNPNPNSMSSSLKSMQKSLQQQLEKAMQMMKDGSSEKSINGELGKAISQQEAMHDLLQKMMNQGQVGSSAYETLKQADLLLNKVKDDILRNNLSSSTIERQKQILTRLLEADKAENERDIDEKRKSNTASKQFFSETGNKFENSQTINNFEEKLLKNKLILNSYYQEKYQKYINVLDSINGEIYKNNFIYK
jgi:hypothetical protein